jgi:hypothetical protein
LDSVALGTGVWCATEALHADERVNPNVGDSLGLARVLADPVRVASIVDWIDTDDIARAAGAEALWYALRGRSTPSNAPIRDVAEMRLIRGFEEVSLRELEALFTARGDGRVSANRAPLHALLSISPLSPTEAERIVTLRAVGVRFAVPEQIVTVAGADVDLEEFAELTRRLSFTDAARTIRLHGFGDAGPRTLHIALITTLVEHEGELVVTALEVRS